MSANTLEQRNSKVSVLRIDHAVKEVVPGTSSFSGRDPSLQGTEDAASAMRSTKEQRKGVEVHPAQITPKCTFKVIQKRRGMAFTGLYFITIYFFRISGTLLVVPLTRRITRDEVVF